VLSSWKHALPSLAVRAYVATVVVAGAALFVVQFPRELPRPALFVGLLLLSCLTSIWKVNLPIPLASSSTLSVSYAANLMSLLLLGTRQATLIAVIGSWTQCTVNIKRPYPWYRTAFSAAGEAITMFATGLVFQQLSGHTGAFDLAALPRPIVGAILTYFVVNTGLVAGAIALTTGRPPLEVWRHEFLWSAGSFFVAGSAGAIGAVLIERGQIWAAVLMVAPVYLTYSTYRTFVGRLDDQRRHRERVAAALEEMTELEQQRNELLEREQAARASAEEANRLKDQFLAIVSHELRTPLNAILGWSDILQRGRLEKVKKERAVRAIYDSARVQARLIDELLDVSRIISGKLRLERTVLDWTEVIRAALDTARPAAEGKGIDIDVQLDPAAGAFVGDAERLQQVVWNLVANAVKFTPQGGTISIRLQRTRDAIELSVVDTGEGIPQHFLPSMFEPFRQADGSNTRRHGGLGLGLAIVKHLVEAHGGTISAQSAGVGQGSTFVISLPMAESSVNFGVPDIAGTRSSSYRADTLVSLEGARVLVVDDDDAGRDVVAAHLEARDAKVIGAASANEALDILERERFDVLLVDIAMPGRDGYELIRMVRGMSPAMCATIPAAALTAFARAEDRRKSLESGFQMHLTKPIDPGALVEAVAALRSDALNLGSARL
jgi:signal transduction histidine kinase/ActR/RegA family two-component response regulator